MKKYFTWTFIKSPQGIQAILILIIIAMVIFWIFYVPTGDTSKDALIKQQQEAIKELQYQNQTEAAYRELMKSKLETILSAVNNKETDKVRIYERIKIEHRYLDSATIPDLQKWFDARTAESGNP
jgi:hypothetical protein